MWKLIFSYVSVEGWVIYSDVHDLLGGPNDAMHLPAYYGEAVHTGRMSHGLAALAALIDRGGLWGVL